MIFTLIQNSDTNVSIKIFISKFQELQGQDLGKFGRDFNVSVLVYSNPEDSQVLMALRERNPEVIIVKGGAVFVESPYMPKNVIQLTEFALCTVMVTLYLSDSEPHNDQKLQDWDTT
jgi:hypothetical protein